MSENYILAFDIGGTKIAAAAFDLDHKRLSDVHSIPTMAHQPAQLTLMNLKRVGSEAGKKAGFIAPPKAVGAGTTGPIDALNGILRDPDSLPNLVGFRLGGFVEQEFQAPLYLDNDANCFALGEAVAGAGRGHEIVVGVTLGTGFGCGIVIGGRIFRGSTGNAGEVAYCPVAGRDFDTMLSGGGVRRFYEQVAGHEAPSAKEIGELAEAGDAAARQTWERYGEAVGTAMGTIAAIVDPSVFVIGGSVARRYQFFKEPLQRSLRAILAPEAAEKILTLPSELGAAAGVTGAAELALGQLDSQ